MNEIIPFLYENRPIRTVTIEGEPWFVAADVCEAIDIDTSVSVNGQMRARDDETAYRSGGLDDDEKGTHIVSTPGGPQEVLVVSEPGLYALILKSRKPEAKLFKRWITHDVIPQIRRTGAYAVPGNLTALEALQQVVNGMVLQERQLTELARCQQHLTGKVQQLEARIEKRMPDDYELQLVTPTQLGKMFEPQLSAQSVNKRLKSAGLQWRVGGEWVAQEKGRQYSAYEPIQLDNGKIVPQLKWQRRVRELI
jgi:prophage antirepressor-like protein